MVFGLLGPCEKKMAFASYVIAANEQVNHANGVLTPSLLPIFPSRKQRNSHSKLLNTATLSTLMSKRLGLKRGVASFGAERHESLRVA